MRRVSLSAGFFLVLTCQAQFNDPNEGKPTGVTLGIKSKIGWMQDFKHEALFSNLPANLRTVRYSPGDTYAYYFPDNTMLYHYRGLLVFNIGPSLNFGDRVEMSFGGTTNLGSSRSNNQQIGCYCSGSTVTYLQIYKTNAGAGLYGDVSVRLKDVVWFTSEVSTYPTWGNITFRQGFSAYGGDDTLMKTNIGNYRTRLVLLSGIKFAGSDKSMRGAFGFRGGIVMGENRLNSAAGGTVFPHIEKSIVLDIFIEGNFLAKKHKK